MMNLYKRLYSKISAWFIKNLLSVLMFTTFVVGTCVVLFPVVVIKIPAGYMGVLYRPLQKGVVEDLVLGEGFHLVYPWNTVHQYSGRIQIKKLELDVLTSDQLRSKVTLTFQFEVNGLTVPFLHKYVGPDYITTMVIPEVTSITREMFGRLSSSQAFTSGINQVVRDIAINADNVIISKLSPPGLSDVRLVRISAVQLDSIAYPTDIQTAIESKLVESQVAEAYVYKIQAAKREVERKVIEAGGIKQFQDIVNVGLTDNYLKLKGIEATAKLAESNNSKMVLFGSAAGGLPIILGGDSIPEVKSKPQKETEKAASKTTQSDVVQDGKSRSTDVKSSSTDGNSSSTSNKSSSTDGKSSSTSSKSSSTDGKSSSTDGESSSTDDKSSSKISQESKASTQK